MANLAASQYAGKTVSAIFLFKHSDHYRQINVSLLSVLRLRIVGHQLLHSSLTVPVKYLAIEACDSKPSSRVCMFPSGSKSDKH